MFRIHHRLIGSVEPFEYLEKTAGETVQAGEALSVANGKLTKCAATVKPEYIAMGGENRSGLVPVIRVLATTIFEVEAAGSLAPAGAACLDLCAGTGVVGIALARRYGMQVTAATANGVFTLMRPAKAGENCVGYFA